ncbi:MAG: hypothetical protein L0Y36_00440 [Planctomycetales bacterium]|nr:hypothetical protein [Planctomycetales bacterium]
MDDGNIKFCVIGDALQEMHIPAHDFVKRHKKYKNILLALRVNMGGHHGNRGSDYIQYFVNQDWHIPKGIVVLAGVTEQANIEADLQEIPGLLAMLPFVPKSEPANALAAKIRKKWGWL